MSHINSTQFGEVIIDDKKYHQVLIVGDKAEERDCEKLKKLFDTTHKIGDWEIEKLLKGNPQVIIIGTGQNGAMELDRETIQKLQSKGAKIISDITPKMIEIYNSQVRLGKLGKRINALIHTTC